MKHYECDGQMNIFEFLKPERIHPVEIKGLCDDAYCPECGYEFWETREIFEHDSMYVDGIIESAGTHGTCNAWNRSKTSEEGYCHLAALKPEKMTIDKAIEALSKEAFVITKNLTEWTAARDLLVDTARKYQKIEEQVEWSDKENHKIDATRMIQIKEILQNQGGRLSKIKE